MLEECHARAAVLARGAKTQRQLRLGSRAALEDEHSVLGENSGKVTGECGLHVRVAVVRRVDQDEIVLPACGRLAREHLERVARVEVRLNAATKGSHIKAACHARCRRMRRSRSASPTRARSRSTSLPATR